MKINHIDHVGIRVTDFDTAIRFYEILGFSVTRKNMTERVVEVGHPSGITLNFLDSANHDHDGQNVLMDIDRKYPGYTHCAFNIESAEETLTFLASHGITPTEGPITFGNGNTSIFIRDPDRNVIEFTQSPAP